MKHDIENLDLRAAFRDEPDACHRALMNAARSVKEEEKTTMKTTTFRTLLIAAIVIVSMMSVAFAASELFGLNDFFQRFDVYLTQGQQEALKPEKEAAWQVGPMTFTLQERVADPYYAYIATKASMTDGSEALIAMEPEERITEELRTALGLQMIIRDYGMGPVYTQPTYQEAAQLTGLPLYTIRATLEIPEFAEYGGGREEILHTLTDTVYINQQYLYDVQENTELPAQLFLRGTHIDPDTCEEIEKWSTCEPYALPVSKMLAEGRYLPETPLVTGDMTLAEIRTELYEAGRYVYRHYQMPDGMPRDIDYPVWDVTDPTPLCKADGTSFMRGISLSEQYDTREWPTVTVFEMVNVTELPQVIQVGGVNYTLAAE